MFDVGLLPILSCLCDCLIPFSCVSVYLNLPPAPCRCQIVFVTRVFKLSHDLCLPPMSDPPVFLDFGFCLNIVCPSFVSCVWTTI